MITNLFHPSGDNVNDNIDQQFCSINFFSFDGVINITHTNAKLAISSSAFRCLPKSPLEVWLPGFKSDKSHYIDKFLPMRWSVFYSFKKSFLQRELQKVTKGCNCTLLK